MAQKAIAEIQKQGKLPILVGGTGLYIESVLYDFGFLDNSTPEERRKLDSMELNQLLKLAAAHKIDISDIDIRNKRRVVRAIEAKGQKPTKEKLRPNTVIVGLSLSAEELEQRIEKRIDAMLAAGMEQEVKQLSKKYELDIEPMKGIGYRAFRGYIEGRDSLEEAKQKFIRGDLNLAKRQRTWFKRNPDIHWFDSAEQAYEYILGILNT
jgi:tRNA dimethylallyltransferase